MPCRPNAAVMWLPQSSIWCLLHKTREPDVRRSLSLACALVIIAGNAFAQSDAANVPKAENLPGAIIEGSRNTTIGGAAPARVGDRTSSGAAIVQGSSNVFINGKPAVTLGDRSGCGGVAVGGAGTVFINGKPVARAGDSTTGCPGK